VSGLSESRKRLYVFLAAGLLVAFGLAGLVSGFASDNPDGLEKVAEDQGFRDTAQDSQLADGPLAGYQVKGVDNDRLSGGLAGIAGVSLTFGLALLVFGGTRALRGDRGDAGTTTSHDD